MQHHPEEWQNSDRPLYAGTLRGYRHFAIGRGAALTGVTYEHFEYNDGETVAECGVMESLETQLARLRERTGEAYDHALRDWGYSPDQIELYLKNLDKEFRDLRRRLEEIKTQHSLKNCTCGFYASYDPWTNFYEADHWTWTPVFAVVEAYGSVVPATKGFRAAKVRIVAICPDRDRRPKYGNSDRGVVDYARVAKRYPGARWYDDKSRLVEDHPQEDLTELLGFDPVAKARPRTTAKAATISVTSFSTGNTITWNGPPSTITYSNGFKVGKIWFDDEEF